MQEQEDFIKMQIQRAWNNFIHGIDLTNLGLNLNGEKDIIDQFQSPFIDQPIKNINFKNYPFPACYSLKTINLSLNDFITKMPEDTLFYIFYNVIDIQQQYSATKMLQQINKNKFILFLNRYEKQWKHHKQYKTWFKNIEILGRHKEVSNIIDINASFFSVNQWKQMKISNYPIDETQFAKLEEFKNEIDQNTNNKF